MLRRLWARLGTKSSYRRHAVVTSLTSVGVYATGLVTGPILARSLGPDGRGDIAAVVAPNTVLFMVLAFGLPTAAAYFVDSVPEKQLLVTATAFGLLVGIPLCTALWFAAPTYLQGHPPVTVSLARVLLLIAPFSVGMSAALEVRRRLNPDLVWNLWRSTAVFLPAIAIVVLAIASKLTLASVLTVNAIGVAVPLVLLAARLRRRPWPRPSIATLSIMLPYAWRTASMGTAISLTNRLDQVILVGLVTPGELGLYAVAVSVASVTNPLTSGLATTLFGHLRGETSEDRAVTRYHRALITTAAVSGAVALGIAIVAPVLIRAAFGSLFAPGTTALRLLLPGAVAFDVLGVIMTKLFSEGRPGEASRAALLGAIVTVAGLVACAPRFGIEGAAAVTSIAWIAQVAYLVHRGALRGHVGIAVGGTTEGDRQLSGAAPVEGPEHPTPA